MIHRLILTLAPFFFAAQAFAALPAGWHELGARLYAKELAKQPETLRRAASQNNPGPGQSAFDEVQAMGSRFPFKQLFSAEPPVLSTPQWRSAVVERDVIRRSGWSSEQMRDWAMQQKTHFTWGASFPDPAGRICEMTVVCMTNYAPRVHSKDQPGVAAENSALFRYLVTKGLADYQTLLAERPRMLKSTPPLPVIKDTWPLPKRVVNFPGDRSPEWHKAWEKLVTETGYYGHQSYLVQLNEALRKKPMAEWIDHFVCDFIAMESGGDPLAMIELLYRSGYTTRQQRKAWFDGIKKTDIEQQYPPEYCWAPKVAAFIPVDKTDLPVSLLPASPSSSKSLAP